MSDEHNRQSERTPLPGQIVGEVTVFQTITILDMSELGVQIEAAIPLQNDSLHDFRLSLGDRSVVVKGRVAYCQIGELRDGTVIYRCGIEFVEPSPHVLSAIHEFVAIHRAPPPDVIDAELT